VSRLIAAAATLVLVGVIPAPRAVAEPTNLDGAVAAVRASGGRYRYGAASLLAADCSGLVSVVQSLAMGQGARRLGDTHTLLAGRWPFAIPGAGPGDEFVIGATPSHMVAEVRGLNIEARQSGEPFRFGSDAASPWGFPHIYHIDPQVLVA
jgi:hypothetical protein